MGLKSIIEKNSFDLLSRLHELDEEQLSELVAYHNHKYFVDNEIEITDEAFDKLVEALRLKNPENPELNRFVDEISNRWVHANEMLSLDKCYDDDTFGKWAQKISNGLLGSPKIDGIACSLIYNDEGNLIVAATRGDGKVGENITKNVLEIENLPKKLDKNLLALIKKDKNLDIRGEIYLPISRFNEFFASQFSNPRNLAAGAVKLKDSSKSKTYGLEFLAYEMRGDNLLTYEEKFNYLKKFNFMVTPYEFCDGIDKAKASFKCFLSLKDTFDFETDGVVFKANSVDDQVKLGYTAHHPKYAIAYKFQSEVAQTKIVDVIWSVARSGVITPVAIFSPVTVAGAKISRATLHNLGQFLKHDIRSKSLVEISRRGGVIPKLERVLVREGDAFLPPTKCPSCHNEVNIVDDFLYCKNPENCRTVKESSLIHFCEVLEMEGLGPKLIKKLVNEGYINNFADIFKLNVNELLTLERMGEVLANKIINEINKKRKISLKIFIQSLGIHEIAENVSSLLADNFLTLEKIQNLKEEELEGIHGIGEKIAQSLILGLKEKKSEIDELLKYIEIDYQSDSKNYDEKHPFYKKSVVFTGSMSMDRKQAQNLVKKFGGITPSSVTKKLDFLVIAEDAKISSKQKEAQKLNNEGEQIKIINENEFYKLVGL